jgi:hypothetical protein
MWGLMTLREIHELSNVIDRRIAQIPIGSKLRESPVGNDLLVPARSNPPKYNSKLRRLVQNCFSINPELRKSGFALTKITLADFVESHRAHHDAHAHETVFELQPSEVGNANIDLDDQFWENPGVGIVHPVQSFHVRFQITQRRL